MTIFAFGQTGSGKTFTITGPDGNLNGDLAGIIPRSLRHIYDQIMQRPEMTVVVKAAYLEIYNEQVCG